MTFWRRFLAWINEAEPRVPEDDIERYLLDNGAMVLDLAPDLRVSVDVHTGLTMAVSQEHRLSDQQGRQLLLAARYAATVPRCDPPAGDPPPDPPTSYDPETNTFTVSLSQEEQEFIADVLAAYFRLTAEETDPRG